MNRARLLSAATALWLLVPAAFGQYGGRPGDAVIYLLSYKGPGNLQAMPPNTVNGPQTGTTQFRTLPLDSIVAIPSTPFPLFRQVLVDVPDELFQVGTDKETTVGIPRLVINDTKVFMLQGTLAVPTSSGVYALAAHNSLIYFPPGIDLKDDISLEDVKFLIFSPKGWPFIIPFEGRGPIVPPGMTGLDYLLATPGLLRLPAFTPWFSLEQLYPGAGWPEGVDYNAIDNDPQMGDTIGQIRLRPGKTTPLFRVPSNSHLVVLSGNIELTPAGGAAIPMKPRDYARIPANFSVKISNPAKYSGPGSN